MHCLARQNAAKNNDFVTTSQTLEDLSAERTNLDSRLKEMEVKNCQKDEATAQISGLQSQVMILVFFNRSEKT